MRRSALLATVALVCAVAACKRPTLSQPGPAQLVVSPLSLGLPDVYVGQATSGTVEVSNVGGDSASLDVAVDTPFTVDPPSLVVRGGEAATVTVHLLAQSEGPAHGTLELGTLKVPVSARALAVPDCASTSCADARFDVATSQCVSTPKAEGTACSTACITGQCHDGTCLGQPASCDDGNGCTTDACNEDVGCTHLPRSCPAPTDPCQAPVCDQATGCGVVPAIDGTLCGVDDCRAATVDVCIDGQCVTRPRPGLGRCTNTWMPLFLTPRYNAAVAYDAVRHRTVLFGGLQSTTVGLAETWEWDGAQWTLRTPPGSPPARGGHAMAYDPFRQTLVLFGGIPMFGAAALDDTWEWDGTTWVQRTTPTGPAARSRHAMAFDSLRDRLVLMGGLDSTGQPLADTWEWDGVTWVQRVASGSPGGRSMHAMAYDAAHHRTVLFGGATPSMPNLADTWLWDGTVWTQAQPSIAPSGRDSAAMAWDSARQRVELVAGLATNDPQSDTWEWDGSNWAQRSSASGLPENYDGIAGYDEQRQRLVMVGGPRLPDLETWELGSGAWQRLDAPQPVARNGASAAWDSARARLVLYGGWASNAGIFDDTWEWDGTAWLELSPATTPGQRSNAGATWDAAANRVVLFGGAASFADLGDTWEWDGTDWSQRATTGPAGRSTTIAYDFARDRTVLFGGEQDQSGGARLADTWEWNGTGWLRRTPSDAPSARTTTLAYDRARQRVIAFGGALSNGDVSAETWSWDGTSWSLLAPTPQPPARRFHAMAYDPSRELVLMFGGEPGPLTDTWEWDGTSWLQRMPAVSPPPTSLAVMVFDEVNQRVVMLGPSGMWWFLP